MDIPSLLQSYGGPGGVVAVAVWLFVTDKKHSSERRAELREDIDRWQAEGVRLWAYMVNDQSRVDELIGMGIEGVMTDNPTLKAVRTA